MKTVNHVVEKQKLNLENKNLRFVRSRVDHNVMYLQT